MVWSRAAHRSPEKRRAQDFAIFFVGFGEGCRGSFFRVFKVITQRRILHPRIHTFSRVLVSIGFRFKRVQKFAELRAR